MGSGGYSGARYCPLCRRSSSRSEKTVGLVVEVRLGICGARENLLSSTTGRRCEPKTLSSGGDDNFDPKFLNLTSGGFRGSSGRAGLLL